MAKRKGIAAAAAAALAEAGETDAAAGVAASDGEQLALAPELAPEVRGPGRPAGALSRRTRDFLAFLDARPDLEMPGVFLARAYSRPVEEMLKELRLADTEENRLWAAEKRLDAAKALAPYVHERRPLAVSVEDKHTLELVLRDERAIQGPTIDHQAMVFDVLGGGDENAG